LVSADWEEAAPVLTAYDADALLESLVAEAVPFPTDDVAEPEGVAEPDAAGLMEGVAEAKPAGADVAAQTGAVLNTTFASLHNEAASCVVTVAVISHDTPWQVSDVVNKPAMSAWGQVAKMQHETLSITAVLPQMHAKSVAPQLPRLLAKQACCHLV
jgi:hypothetical protein